MSLILDKKAGLLHLKAYDTREEMGREAAKDAAARMKAIIQQKGIVNALFAAAPSQNEFLKYFVEYDIDWGKVRAFCMDEYIGLYKNATQEFGNFLKEAIFDRVPFLEVNYLDGQTKDPQAECVRYSKLLAENLPDIVFLGIGENGHLAFNDPDVADFNDPDKVKVVKLDDICRNQQVNDGCFEKFEEVPETAFTLTMSMIMSITEAVIIVPGTTKKDAITNTVNAVISTSCPATILRNHKSAVIYLDKDSAKDLL